MNKNYHLPLLGDKTYQNPLSFANPNQTNADPFIMKHRGIYYCYSSGHDGVNVSLSYDLVNWEYKGYAIVEEGRQEYWAPCAYYYNGLFYLYYSNAPAGEFDPHEERLRVAVSEDPLSGFSLEKVFFDTFSIDAHVVRDVDGSFYLFYSPNNYMGTHENAAGTVILVDRMIDPLTLEGKPVPVVIPTIAEEVFAQNRFGDGRDWHTIEGALYFIRHNMAYVMYSANAFTHENYFIGYSTANKNAPIHQLSWRKHPDDYTYDPFVRRNNIVEGTGHNSLIKAPNNVDYWLVYHGRNCADELIVGTEQRQMRIDPVFFNGDTLVTNAPSYDIQSAPAQPLHLDYFTNINPDNWEIITGNVGTENKNLYSKSTNGSTIVMFKTSVENYLLEVDLASEPTHMGARYGVFLYFDDELNYLEAQLDIGKNNLSLLLSKNGILTTLQSIKLEPEFNATAYHKLTATRVFDQFFISIDDVPRLKQSISLPFGHVALVTRYTIAKFSAFSITKTIDLYGESLGYLSRIFSSNVPLIYENGQVSNLSPNHATLTSLLKHKEDFTQEVTFSVIREQGYLTYFPTYQDQDNHVGININKTSCTVFIIANRERIELTQFNLKSPITTVRSVHQNNKLCLLIAGIPLVVPLSFSNKNTCIIELLGASIHHFSLTSID